MGSKGLALTVVAIILLGIMLTNVRPAFAFPSEDFNIAATPAAPPTTQSGMRAVANITITNNSTVTDTAITLTINATAVCSLNPTVFATISSSQNANSTLSCNSPAATFVVNVTATDGGSGRVHSASVTFVFKNLVNLDANSISTVDTVISTSSSQAKTFNIGAILNASTSFPVNGVFGWQFTLNYNASAFTPQGDPNPTAAPGNSVGLYVDGAGNTVNFGSQTGTANWAGLLSANKAFSVVTTQTPLGGMGSISIAFTILAPNPAVTITGKSLLANVAFELVNEPSTPQTFTISNIIFVDSAANELPVSSGSSANETLTNTPPIARFTVTALLEGDTSCIAVTGAACSPYAFKFNGTMSSGTIIISPGTADFFWDFGDGTQDGFYPGSTYNGGVSCTNADGATFTCQGEVAIHDYGTSGQFTVTLRVIDSSGATGSARDSTGGLILNLQPSHASVTVLVANGFFITVSPTALSWAPGTEVVGTADLTLTSVTTGFSGIISLSAKTTPFPTNAPATSFNASTVNLPAGGSVGAKLTVSAGNLTPRIPYNITVIGTIGPVANNVTIPVIPTTLAVQPSIVTGVASGNIFTVKINTTAALLFSWQFQLNYNQSMLQVCISCVRFGPFWAAASNRGEATLIKNVNQTSGKIYVAATLHAGVPPLTGNGTLATINFTAYSTGVTALSFTNGGVNTVYLINDIGLGQILLFTQTNGVFCNLSQCLDHNVAISKFTLSSTSVNPGSAVTVSAKVNNIGLNPENVTVTFQAGTNTIGSKQVLLVPGNSTIVTMPWDTTGLSPGSYTIKASVALNGATNQNTVSNSASATVTLNSSNPFPWMYIAAGVAAGVAAAIVATLLMLRRRRMATPTRVGVSTAA